MSVPDPSDPPGHLGAAGKAQWRQITREWELEPWRLAVLENACALLDTVSTCRHRIKREGLTVKTPRGGIAAHPALTTERSSMALHARLIASLHLEDHSAPASSQPSRNRGGRPRKDEPTTPKRKAPHA